MLHANHASNLRFGLHADIAHKSCKDLAAVAILVNFFAGPGCAFSSCIETFRLLKESSIDEELSELMTVNGQF
jgi:hypothetical protein